MTSKFPVWPDKAPNEELDYQIDWSQRLLIGRDRDTIDASVWTIPSGLVLENNSRTVSTTTAWISGGTLGETYALINKVTTVGGRIMEQTVMLSISAK